MYYLGYPAKEIDYVLKGKASVSVFNQTQLFGGAAAGA